MCLSARNSPGSPDPRVLREGASTRLCPGRERQIRVPPAVGKPLWNPLGNPQPAYPPITQTQGRQDFWSNPQEEGRRGGGEFSQGDSRKLLVELGAKQPWEKVQGSPLPGPPITCPTLDLLNPLATLEGGTNRIFNSFKQHLLIAHLF